MNIITAGSALVFTLIHLMAGRMHFLNQIPRSRWLSFAGGISIAYVFIHILPELMESQLYLNETLRSQIEVEIFLMTLIGLVVFYSLERLVMRTRTSGRVGESNRSSTFWLHTGSFAVYNAIIGYLLVHREAETWQGLVLYVIAIGLHFVVNDFGLRQHHQKQYTDVVRWVLSSAILAGWLIGILTEIDELELGLMFAFISGGIILNTLKEELPEERESRIEAFVAGVIFFTVLLLLI
jgi:zinc transporter ZupT